MFDLIPFGRENRNLFNYLDNMEKNFFGDWEKDFSQFRTDIVDKGDQYILEAELPGFSKEDIHIDLSNNYLTIHAEHKEEREETDEKKQTYIRRERKYGSFSRSFDVSGIETDKISACYKHGVLSLTMQKETPKELPSSRQINIE